MNKKQRRILLSSTFRSAVIDDDYGFATKPDHKWGPVRMTMVVLFFVIAGVVPPITLALTAHEVIPTVEKLIDVFGG